MPARPRLARPRQAGAHLAGREGRGEGLGEGAGIAGDRLERDPVKDGRSQPAFVRLRLLVDLQLAITPL